MQRTTRTTNNMNRCFTTNQIFANNIYTQLYQRTRHTHSAQHIESPRHKHRTHQQLIEPTRNVNLPNQHVHTIMSKLPKCVSEGPTSWNGAALPCRSPLGKLMEARIDVISKGTKRKRLRPQQCDADWRQSVTAQNLVNSSARMPWSMGNRHDQLMYS